MSISQVCAAKIQVIIINKKTDKKEKEKATDGSESLIMIQQIFSCSVNKLLPAQPTLVLMAENLHIHLYVSELIS